MKVIAVALAVAASLCVVSARTVPSLHKSSSSLVIRAEPVSQSDVGTAECKICQLVSQYLESELHANATTTEIENALDQVCSHFGGFKGVCDDFVAKYTPQLIQTLENDANATKLCASFCNAPVVAVATPVTGGAECKICQLVANRLKSMLGSNATEAEIEQALDDVCNHLGGFKGVCEDFVTKYTPELIQALENDLNATAICDSIGLCKTVAVATPVAVTGGAECKICQLVSSRLENILSENATTTEIENALDNICADLGGFKGVCEDFVAKYTPQLIQTLENDANATKLCASFCNEAATPVSLPLKVQSSHPRVYLRKDE